MSKHTETAGQYPDIPLRTEVQLPGHVGPLEIGREASVRAIEAATRDDNLIVIIPQKNPAVRDPGQRDLHEVGVRAEIVQVVKHSPGRFTCVMRFLERVHIDALVATEPFLIASVSALHSSSSATAETLIATTAKVRDYLLAVVTDAQAKESKPDRDSREGRESKEAKEPRGELSRAQVQAIVDPDKLVDAAAPYLELERDDLTTLLIETDTMRRLEGIIPLLERQARVLRRMADIGAELEGESSRTHRERVLRDRMRQIQEELGEQDDNAEIDELRKKIEDSKMSDEVRAVAPDGVVVARVQHRAHLRREPARDPVERVHGGPARRHGRARHPRGGALRPREGEAPHPRVPRGAQARAEQARTDSSARRAARRRQDVARQVERELARPQVRPDLARRRARRGRGSRPPAHVY